MSPWWPLKALLRGQSSPPTTDPLGDGQEREEEQQEEPLHPKENPILQVCIHIPNSPLPETVVSSIKKGIILRFDVVQGYLAPGVHGTYRQYVLELLVVLGLLLPWIGPLFGRAVMTPIVLLTVQNGKIITKERDCFGGGVGPTECPAESYFDYYFWNITNPNQVSLRYMPPAAGGGLHSRVATSSKNTSVEYLALHLEINLEDVTEIVFSD